jgi:hypothetical protein
MLKHFSWSHIDDNRCKMKIMINEQNNNKDKMIELLIKQLDLYFLLYLA